MRPIRLLPATCCAVAALLLAGCVEVDEQWTFDTRGGGTYALEVAWDADLWRRAHRAVGPKGTRMLVGRGAFPLSAAQVRDGLVGLEGVKLEAATDGVRADGRRVLSLRVAFRALDDLLKWEVLARRRMHLRVERDGDGEDAPRRARFSMEPLTYVPVLDTVLALRARYEREASQPAGPESLRRRLDLDPERAKLIWDMVRLPLAKTRIRVRVDTPGDALEQDGSPVRGASRSTTFTFDWARLRATPRRRGVSLAWHMSELDTLRPVRHRMPAPR